MGNFEIMHTLAFFVLLVEVEALFALTCVTSRLIHVFILSTWVLDITLVNIYDNKKR